MNYTIYILITTIIIIYLTVYSTICSSKEAFTNDHSNTNFTYSMKVFISDKGDHDKPSVQLSRTDKTPKNISEHEWANKHITKHEKTTPTHKETSKHAAEAEAAAVIPTPPAEIAFVEGERPSSELITWAEDTADNRVAWNVNSDEDLEVDYRAYDFTGDNQADFFVNQEEGQPDIIKISENVFKSIDDEGNLSSVGLSVDDLKIELNIDVKGLSEGTAFRVGAQDIHYEDKGAYTSKISAEMVKELCEYVIVGHSERRSCFTTPLAKDNF